MHIHIEGCLVSTVRRYYEADKLGQRSRAGDSTETIPSDYVHTRLPNIG